VDAQPNRRLAPIDPSHLTLASIDSDIAYLDSPTDYRESLQEVNPTTGTGELLILDDGKQFPWITLMMFMLVLSTVIVIIFFLPAALGV
jgi:hypothetical protein